MRRIGALPELVEPTGAGFTFTTPAECRDAIERLRTEPALRTAMGARGREWARKVFGWDAIGRSMRDAYAEALSRSRSRAA